MFHYRWTYEQDQQSAAKRIVEMLFEGAEAPEGAEESVRTRMVGRLHHVGSSPETAPLIEGSFTRLIGLLEAQLKGRAYLFGGRPTLADFGLAAQLKQLLSDPTPGALLKAQAPETAAWVARMEHPRVEGPLETLDAVRGRFGLLRRGGRGVSVVDDGQYRRSACGSNGVSVDIGGTLFVRSHSVTRPRRSPNCAVARRWKQTLAALLESGCARFLGQPPRPSKFRPRLTKRMATKTKASALKAAQAWIVRLVAFRVRKTL